MSLKPRLLLCAALFAFAVPVWGQVPPEKALSTFKVSDGLEISLFASEPLFVNPTCFDIDHKGRVWVCESVNYRNKLRGLKQFNRPEGDRIVILEDSTGKGVADKAVTFYQSPELLAPLGIAVAKDPVGPGYKVYVCQSPDILVFEDKDGDGKADGPPSKLLSDFGDFDHDHGVHSILIGPDNRLYFTVGDTGVRNLKGVDGKKSWNSNNTDVRAGTIWRCDLDGKNLELIAHNFRNEYECAVDSFGTVFVSDNDDDGNQQTRICSVMPGGNYGYHPRGQGQTHWHEEQPGIVPKVLRTYFGSPTGMCFYEGTLLPKKYWGQLLHTDAGPRHVRCYHLKPQGAGYDVEREDMVTSSDNWFRPSDVCVAPDGSVFVADWYDPGVGGHGMGDTTRGRIYRIAPKGNKYSVPKYDLTNEMVEALASPNQAVRYMAMQMILDRVKDPQLLMEAAGLHYAPKKDEATKFKESVLMARAMWLAARMGWWEQQLKDKEFVTKNLPDLFKAEKDTTGVTDKIHFIYLRTLLNTYPDLSKMPKDAVAALRKAGEKASPAIRREILLHLRNAEPDFARPWILELARHYDGKDRFFLCAVGIAVGQDPARRKVILADFQKTFPEWNDQTAGLIWELRPESMIPRLGDRLLDNTISESQRAQIVDILAAADDNAGRAFLKALQGNPPAVVRDKLIDNLKLFLPGKWRELRQSKELAGVIESLLKQPDSQVTGLLLVGAAEKTEYLRDVQGIVADDKAPLAVRKAAVQTLGMLPSADAARTLVGLVLPTGDLHPPLALRTDAIQMLGKQAADTTKRPDVTAPPVALKALQDLAKNSKAELPLRIEALGALTGGRAGSEWLLDLQAKTSLPEELKGDTGRLLRNSSHVDLRNKAMIVFPAPGRLDPKKLPPISELVQRKGDPQRGKQLLAASLKNDMQCLKCHTIRGIGGQVGPDLSVIGKKASRENLFESLLLPSKAVADQYVTWIVETSKGQTLTGLLVEETAEAVTIRDANGKDTKVPAKEVESKVKSPKSIMPEDLVVTMTPENLVDMVEYLFTLKTPLLSFDSWHIAGPFDNGEDDKGLDTVFGPEKGVDLKASYPGKGGAKVVWKTVKPDLQGYVDLQAFFSPGSSQIVSYLYREVESPADQEATILLGNDDGCKLWVNDQLVHTDRRHVAAQPEASSVKVKLHKGRNRILLKINNGDGAHGFYLTIQAEQELKRIETK